MRLTLLFHMLPRFVRLMSSRTNGGMLSALTSRVGNLALRQNVSYRVALEQTNRTILRNLAEVEGLSAAHVAVNRLLASTSGCLS